MDSDSMEDLADYFYDFADFEQPPPEIQTEDEYTRQAVDELSCDIEGKLYVKLNNIHCQHLGKRWYQKLTCFISVDGFEKTVPLKQLCSNGVVQHDTDTVVFDIYEYFGPANITITLQLSQRNRYCYRTTLHHVNSAQSREMTKTPPTYESFWSVHHKVLLKSADSKFSIMRKATKLSVPCEVTFKYIPVKSFLSEEDNSLRLVVRRGSQEVLCDVLETLSRNNLLRRALGVRSPLYKCDDGGSSSSSMVGGSCLPLEHALLARNTAAVGVLLRRAGNWCFQYVQGPPPAAPPAAAVVGKLSGAGDVEGSPNLEEFQARHHHHFPYHVPKQSSCGGSHMGSALHAAIVGGDAECITMVLRFLRRYHANIISWSAGNLAGMLRWVGGRRDGYSPLLLACSLGFTPCIRALIAEGCSLEEASELQHGRLSPLMLACSSGSLEAVVELLSHFNSAESNMSLDVAAQQEKYHAVGLMKCSPHATNVDGKQALAFAAEAGHVDIVVLLIEKHVSYSHADVFGSTALHLAATNGHMAVCRAIVAAEERAVSLFNNLNFARSGELAGRENVVLGCNDDQGPKTRLPHVELKDEVRDLETAESQNVPHDWDGSSSSANNSSRPYVSLPLTTCRADPAGSLPPPTASSAGSISSSRKKQPRVLANMTPRPHVLRRVDKRGRTASDVALMCGHLFVASFLQSAEEQERKKHLDLVSKSSTADGARSAMTMTMTTMTMMTGATSPPDDAADNEAYMFAKTLYFDPSYDSIFKDSCDASADEDESDESDDDVNS